MQNKATQAASLAHTALKGASSSLSSLPTTLATAAGAATSPFTSSSSPPAPPPKKVLTPQELNLRRTARTLWSLSFGLLWVGLTSHGWEQTEWQGILSKNEQTYHQTYTGNYGLREVFFQLTTNSVKVPYSSWNLAQGEPLPYTLILLVQCCMAVATVAGIGVCAAHLRAWCAKTTEKYNKYTSYSAWAAIPQCVFSALAVVVWHLIDHEAFYVFCTLDGCLKKEVVEENGGGVKKVGIYYAWVSVLASAVLALFVSLTLWRLAHYDDKDEAVDDSEEVEIQLVSGKEVRSVRHDARTVGKSHLVMGAKVATPQSTRHAAESWNPQRNMAQVQYSVVGKKRSSGSETSVGGGGAGTSTPSWLEGV